MNAGRLLALAALVAARLRLEPGPRGDHGDKGDRGETGVPGPSGARGATGDRGAQGDRGVPGPKGSKGDRGERGDSGPRGLHGDRGDTGPRGAKGEPGAKGDKGEPGLVWKGTFAVGLMYNENEVVEHFGSSYVCVSRTGQPPSRSSTLWELVAKAGEDGRYAVVTSAGSGGGISQAQLDAAIAAHAASSDPHPQYLTQAEGDAAYDVLNAASSAITAHLAAGDPHPQYTTAGEAAAAAPVQSVAGRTGAVVLAKADVGLGNVDNTSDAAKPISTATQTALDAKQAAGALVSAKDPGNVAVATEQTLVQVRRLTLTGSERASVAGTGELLVTDLGNAQAPLYLGTPKAPRLSFSVANDYFLTVLQRLTLAGTQRATLEGSADLILTDDCASRSRLVLSGRG